MRHSLPIIHCLPDDIKAKLLGMITDKDSVPNSEWVEWGSLEDKPVPQVPPGKEDYAREMRQAPSRSRG